MIQIQCDCCGKPIVNEVVKKIDFPIRTFEEGKEPYLRIRKIDICDNCLNLLSNYFCKISAETRRIRNE